MTRNRVVKAVAVIALSMASYVVKAQAAPVASIAPAQDSKVAAVADARGKLVVKVQEKDRSALFSGTLTVTVITPEGARNRYSVSKNAPKEIAFKDHGYGKYRVILTTDVGTGLGADDLDFDQEALWAQGWAPSDSHAFVNPQERDFTVQLSVNVDSGNQDTDQAVAFEITPLNSAQLSNGPQSPQSMAKNQPNLLLPGQAMEPMVACSTCLALYTTPGTMYYMNHAWYNNCLTNPPCT